MDIDLNDLKSYLEIKRRYEKSTVKKRLREYREFKSFCEIYNFSLVQGVEPFLSYKKKHIKNNSINEFIKCFKVLDTYFEDRNIPLVLSKNLKRFDDDTEEKDPLSVGEIERILTFNRSGERGCHTEKDLYLNRLYKDITLFIIMTGLRFGDVAKLKVENIRDDKLRFRQQKTGKYATNFLSEPLLSCIRMRIKNKVTTDLVFFSSSGSPVISSKYNIWLKAAGESVRLRGYQKRCHAHNLRHSYALIMLKSKVDLRSIQLLMGHTNISTTAGYLQLDDSHLQEQAKRHPIARQHQSPVETFKDIVEAIKSFRIDSDKRFTYSFNEENNKLVLELEINSE